ncbi:MAG TPA: 4-hydroxy-3-methylbut-2-enyl diphosphate reductase, partial [Psychrobacter sp.]|nr:4-hydroxy-3-methylbut-2-enyl diphosphate reductase [Psychrobacter sp.]
ERMNCRAYLIDNASEMDKRWLDGVQSIGVTAGASAPEVLIQEVLQQLQDWGGDLPSELSGIEENVTFSLPKALRIPVTQVGK